MTIHAAFDASKGDFPRTLGTLRTEPLARADAVVMRASGEFDLSNCENLRDQLLATMSEPLPLLVLDLSGVRFIDSAALNTLLIVGRHAEAVRTTLRLAAPSPIVAKLLHLTSLDTVFDVHPDVDAALTV
ncbi:STAS domain-containing protein [Tenggerimyces flavus]|uniref:Anti-sigma factor antagonist n=1 Tax=Tenggerimyces flavus TaxID=1708749 RepID=A0ABV7YKN0_9ACTN|nr:STAS domain-containing protein [Tenggerimyces flavus]MBM7789844.1 anti-anti-sigma factor [Tenggerimyces flavus]